jgi:hypothetical protein
MNELEPVLRISRRFGQTPGGGQSGLKAEQSKGVKMLKRLGQSHGATIV